MMYFTYDVNSHIITIIQIHLLLVYTRSYIHINPFFTLKSLFSLRQCFSKYETWYFYILCSILNYIFVLFLFCTQCGSNSTMKNL